MFLSEVYINDFLQKNKNYKGILSNKEGTFKAFTYKKIEYFILYKVDVKIFSFQG